jgi:formylglycine-generating enzyme
MDAALLADQNAALWLSTTPRRENVPEPNPPGAAVNLSVPLPSDRRSVALLILVCLLLIVLGLDGCRLLRGGRRQPEANGGRSASAVDFEGRLSAGRAHQATSLGLELELLAVPAGRFERLFADDEAGRQRVAVVAIAAFWFGRHEVTQEEYFRVMGVNPSAFAGEQRPVETVSWLDARAFCQRLTGSERAAGRLPPSWEYRLPTEMEWEYAARAGGEPFAAASLERQAWFRDNADRATHPVGGKKANRSGFHDLYGNVNEWCLDWLGRVPFADGDAALQGELRGCRGGSWLQSAEFCHPDKRVAMHWESANNIIGFRIALAPVGQLPELVWKR